MRHPLGRRLRRTAGQAHTSRAELDEKQDVDGLEEQGLDREEVAGQDLVAVAGEELPPGTAPAPPLGCRWQAVTLEDGPDGRVGDAMAELGQLALAR
ncbi:MAG: hypothetical protein ABR559_02685, partial [Gemmatimonadota bacterium]